MTKKQIEERLRDILEPIGSSIRFDEGVFIIKSRLKSGKWITGHGPTLQYAIFCYDARLKLLSSEG